MKKVLSFVLVVAVTAALFTGCGCEANVSDHPGGMITEEPTVMPRPTATHATEPSATTLPRATEPSMTTQPNATDDTGATGETGESSMPTDATIDQRARNRNTVR